MIGQGNCIDNKCKYKLHIINVKLTFPATKFIYKYDDNRHGKVIVVGVVKTR